MTKTIVEKIDRQCCQVNLDLDKVDHPANETDCKDSHSYSGQGYQVYRCKICGDYWGCRWQYDEGTGEDDRWQNFGLDPSNVKRHY